MKIQTILSTNYGITIPDKNINFRAKYLKTGKDVFSKQIVQKRPIINNLRAGTFGTCCDESVPLKDFFKQFNSDECLRLHKNGLSTNIGLPNKGAYADSFLKSNWENPLSTSGVMDCSVMYLSNENTKTHFLYHIYRTADYKNTVKIIKQFMPEGYTNGALVPGVKGWVERHKKYLYEVFSAMKDTNPRADVKIFHFSSPIPEVVGYKGSVYEIPRKDVTKICQNSFKIEDIQYYDKLHLIDECNNIFVLKKLAKSFKKDKIDDEMQKTIQKMISDKIQLLKKDSDPFSLLKSLFEYIIGHKSN